MTMYLEQIGSQSTQSGPTTDQQRVTVTGVRAAYTGTNLDRDDMILFVPYGLLFDSPRWAFLYLLTHMYSDPIILYYDGYPMMIYMR